MLIDRRFDVGIERQTDWKHKKAKNYLIMSEHKRKVEGTYKMSDLMKPQDQSHPHLDVPKFWICRSRSVTRKYFNQCLNRFLGAEDRDHFVSLTIVDQSVMTNKLMVQ